MSVKVTLLPTPSLVPAGGWFVSYRIKGSGAALIPLGPFMSYPVEFTTADPAGTLYEGGIQKNCAASGPPFYSPSIPFVTPCACDPTFVPTPDGSHCEKTESVAPTITNSGYCLAISQNGAYTGFESRIYNVAYTDAYLALPAGTPPGLEISHRMTLVGQWANPAASISIGPMNRAGVWIDSDCNGVKNSLSIGAKTTIGFVYNNVGGPRTVFVGLGSDNMFEFFINGVNKANCGLPATPTSGSQTPFKIWHIIPVSLVSGVNYFNVVGTGDGTTADSLAMVIYDNTANQIAAATNDSQLNILFTTENLRGDSYDVATCPATYSLDTSGGQGNYMCRRTVSDICNPAP